MITPSKPRFEHHEDDPLGIGQATPRISWSFRGSASDWHQESHDLEIQYDDQKPEIHSFVTEEHNLVPWPSRPLCSRERAKVRVRVKGTADEGFSEWSKRAVVETGLLESGDWLFGNGSSVGGYQVSCGTDFPGNDLSNAPSPNFSSCAALCDRFSYVGGNNAGVCYFKSKQGSPVSNPNVDSGFRPTPVTLSNPITTTTQATTTQATTTQTTTTAVTAPSAAPSSCAALVNSPPAGYTISYKTDRPGGDLSNPPAPSFAACAPLCNALSNCAGYAYVGGNNAGVCYFKSTLTSAVTNDNVDFAAKNNFNPPSTTITTSAAATTTTRAPVYTCLCPAVTF
ncbi:putative PAN/Apple domain, immunoglobulin-like protein [Septoria linicola]|nr:putative PAN/Apple domain, immunoglobulin-like protein [Septoria linicola]